MSVYRRKDAKGKRTGNYIVDFWAHGKRTREFLRTDSRESALKIERELKARAEEQAHGIAAPSVAPTLADFIREDFWPYVTKNYWRKKNTHDYYLAGCAALLKSGLAGLTLDQINSQHVTAYGAECRDVHGMAVSTINRNLRTLKRALSLAREWGRLAGLPKLSLMQGEVKRDRVLTSAEVNAYLNEAKTIHQDWYDCALLLAGTALRPAEAYVLSWENVWFNGTVKVSVIESKTKSGKRVLPLAPVIYQRFGIPDVGDMLWQRHKVQGEPLKGYVFPRPDSATGHLTEGTVKKWHKRTLAALERKRQEHPELPAIEPFEPYIFRHSFLTWLAPYFDTFALAKWAGHSSVRVTERYVHPEEKTLQDSLSRLALSESNP